MNPFVAAKEGNLKALKSILRVDEIDKLDEKTGENVLQIASENGHSEIISYLLSLGSNVNSESKDGFTSLRFALAFGHLGAASFLINKGANPNGDEKFRPFALAVWKGFVEIAKLLISKGADPNLIPSPFHIAVEKNYIGLVSLMLDKGVDVNRMNLVHYLALTEGHSQLAVLLLQRGADPIKQNFSFGLFYSLQMGFLEVSQLFVLKGADPNISDSTGKTAFHTAVEKNLVQLVALMLERKADPSKSTKEGFSSLYFALTNGHSELAVLLLDHGADPNGTESFRPLNFALEKNFEDIARLLILKGAIPYHSIDVSTEMKQVDLMFSILDKEIIVNRTNKEGFGYLYYALANGHPELAVLLLDRGADPNGTESFRPLNLALEKNFEDIARLLILKGADPNLSGPDSSKKTAFHIAVEKNCVQLISLMFDKGVDLNNPEFVIQSLDSGFLDLSFLLINQGFCFNDENLVGHKSPFQSISQQGHIQLAELLIEKGFNINKPDGGITPLAWACQYSSERLVKCLLSQKATFPTVTSLDFKWSNHPLFHAIISQNERIITLLLSRGASPEIKDQSGHDVFHFIKNMPSHINELLLDKEAALFECCELCDEEECTLILNRGADPNTRRPKDGMTPLFIAIRCGKSKMVQILIKKTDLENLFYNGKNALLFAIQEEQSACSSIIWSSWVQLPKADQLVRESLIASPSVFSLSDESKRHIVSLAVPAIMKVINETMLWHGRYRLLESRPEHQSATCYVFKAEDQNLIDEETGEKAKVALKLMMRRDQFDREIDTRNSHHFEERHVIHFLNQFVPPNAPDVITVASDQLQRVPSKELAERLFLISLPLADRNMFVALKQERFAGNDWNMVRFILKDLVEAVTHVHSKGIIHADLKPLNIVRVNGDWRLIDFDACCVIGRDHTGLKSSSAFCPPESIYVNRDLTPPIASIKSREHQLNSGLSYELLLAHPSFDVWGLGCIFYMLSTDCRMLFQGGQDDNLRADENIDSLFELAEWSDALNAHKLSFVENPLARNLLSRMLMKDPLKRPSLEQILDHPFLTGKQVSRLVGEKAEFDVFLSYRVWCDSPYVEHLYKKLTDEGLKVWWDKKELKSGENWEEGFCNGLVNSRIFVPLLSQKALSSFSSLETTSKCDNVLLEHRLALELKQMGLIESILPVVLGEPVVGPVGSEEPSRFTIDRNTLYPKCPEVCVETVERNTCKHLLNQALGSPLQPCRAVQSIFEEITKMQGVLIDGDYDQKMNEAVVKIKELVKEKSSQGTLGDDTANLKQQLVLLSSNLHSESSRSEIISSMKHLINQFAIPSISQI